MLKSLTLLQGPEGHKTPVKIECEGVTILVGPNNSGKSLALSELFRLVTHESRRPPRTLLLKDFTINIPNSSEMLENLQSTFDVVSEPNQNGDPQLLMIFDSYHRPDRSSSLPYEEVKRRLSLGDEKLIISTLLLFMCIHLTGRERFQLLTAREVKPLFGGERSTRSTLSILYHNPASVDAISQLLRDFFGYEMFIDLSDIPLLRVRLSREPVPEDVHVHKSATAKVAQWCKKQTLLDHASDGVQCLVSILSALHAHKSSVILIDEPEVFLHPAPARRLGAQLGDIARNRLGNVFASTHSADFLLGCVQAGTPVNIIRLGYRDEVAEVYAVSSEELSKFARKPLVRSTNAVAALFADGAIVAEADGDRVLYETAFHYLEEKRPSGCAIHFANGRGKGTVHELVGPLRKLGVAAAVVVDMDILEHKGECKALLAAAQYPRDLISVLQSHRDRVEKAFCAAGRSMKQGITALEGEARIVTEDLINALKEYGIFIVPGGQLEAWLPDIAGGMEKDARVTEILRHLDERGGPKLEEFDKDVWEFIGDIVRWIKAPQRKGTSRRAHTIVPDAGK